MEQGANVTSGDDTRNQSLLMVHYAAMEAAGGNKNDNDTIKLKISMDSCAEIVRPNTNPHVYGSLNCLFIYICVCVYVLCSLLCILVRFLIFVFGSLFLFCIFSPMTCISIPILICSLSVTHTHTHTLQLWFKKAV